MGDEKENLSFQSSSPLLGLATERQPTSIKTDDVHQPEASFRAMKSLMIALTLLFGLLLSSNAIAQDKSTGGLKGKVRVETGTPAGVSVVVRQGEQEVRRATTDKDGDFRVANLKPGLYGVTFRKPGLSIGTIENVEVKAGKTRSLGDRLILTIDEGSIAFIRGSVFSPEGRSVARVKVELARILDDGSTKKIDGRLSDDTGRFVFRLTPDPAKYRITVKPEHGEPLSKDVEVDGAAVYRIALSLLPRDN